MATFVYQAISEEGRRHRGTLTADSPRNARDQLRARGLTVHDLRVTGARQPARWLGRAASVSSVSRFLVDLQVMLGVGTPLVTAIDVLLPDYSGLRDVLLDVRERVCGGSSLAAAMQAHPGCFDPLACSMVAAGEQGGKLEEALQRLNDYRERSGRFRNQLVSALLYPGVILLMCGVVGLVLMTWVLPPLLQTLAESGKPLPPLTAGVKWMSDLLVGQWMWLLLVFALLVGVAVWVLQSQRPRLQRWMLRWPVLGMILRKQTSARLAATMSSLLSAGIPLVETMRLCRSESLNKAFADDLESTERAIEAGRDLASALPADSVFPTMLRHVFAVGQESGQLAEVLMRLSIDYDREVEQSVSRWMALLQPMLIAILAGVVGLIAMATILPIMEAGNVL